MENGLRRLKICNETSNPPCLQLKLFHVGSEDADLRRSGVLWGVENLATCTRKSCRILSTVDRRTWEILVLFLCGY